MSPRDRASKKLSLAWVKEAVDESDSQSDGAKQSDVLTIAFPEIGTMEHNQVVIAPFARPGMFRHAWL
jgi:hypothetical protein